ncbi:nitrous oxide reductase family maturation protein NosD [Lysobacter ciconiae]|uniref:Nitrous oxide reductase family maturation protein NosD n=1 Tax=Novilysobacter ciconiae TaxID=2781022 RepID=A0A7S6ZTB7_9GAMM|nr:nitrous oxide reductase family maturation protein NosD [Lysobacter ciconiae]QOW20539.1 nitrous oxide reductase family maturation protein NosD [Lysobacter ciconiae]
MGRFGPWRPLGWVGFPVKAAAAAHALACVAVAAGALVWAPAGYTAELRVQPGTSLQPVIEAAASGDTIRLAAGRHAGPLLIDRTLSLVGEPGAVLTGPGLGSVVTVTAPEVQIRGMEITGSGLDVPAMDSAILVKESAPRADIRDNHLVDNLFGVYLHGAAGSIVQDNVITGRKDLRLAEAGNGVSIWNAPDAKVIGNTISHGRDGIFVKVSKHNTFENNTFSDLRFAIHYMYTHDSRIIGNRSRGNHVGWAIMYSERLEIRDNVSDNDRDHGLMLNSTNASQVVGNTVRGGGEKCVFVYNANVNRIVENWFEGCPIGIHFTAGSEGNVMTGNAFVANRMQVKYVGTRYLDWTSEGRGNYWSDNPAYDLDGDGIADRPYRPNDVMDEILWTLPQAKVLVSSPAVQMIRWAQARFPALYPGGVVDSAPLMRPPQMTRADAS